jgi:hypothetical protein
MKRPTLPRAIALPIAAILLLSACTSGPAADVSSLDSNVTLAVSSGDENPITETTEAHLGDTVSTDDGGRAQLDYPDGSLTRLGPSTRFTVVELPDGETERTLTELEVGETWHRVEELTGDDASYEVETPVGTAAVRGTAFSLTCTEDGICTLTVLEGTVEFLVDDEVIVVEAFERLVVPDPAGGTPESRSFPTDLMSEDAWISGNAELDGPFEDQDAVEAAGIAGAWTATRTLVSSDDPDLTGVPVGTVETYQWDISGPDCTETCTWTVASSSGSTFDFVAEGNELVRPLESQLVDCVYDDTGEVMIEDVARDGAESRLTVSENEEGDGLGSTATRLTGQQIITREMLILCEDLSPGTIFTAVWELELARIS